MDAVKGLSTVLFVETAAGTIDRAVQEIVELAVELGADQDVEAQRKDYDAARARISEVASSLNNSQVLFASADPDTIRVSRSGFPILADLAGLALPSSIRPRDRRSTSRNWLGRWRTTIRPT